MGGGAEDIILWLNSWISRDFAKKLCPQFTLSFTPDEIKPETLFSSRNTSLSLRNCLQCIYIWIKYFTKKKLLKTITLSELSKRQN